LEIAEVSERRGKREKMGLKGKVDGMGGGRGRKKEHLEQEKKPGENYFRACRCRSGQRNTERFHTELSRAGKKRAE